MSDAIAQQRTVPLARLVRRKVPEVTLLFWVVKLLTTAMGESTSDYLVYHINPYIAVALGALGLFASLILQLTVRRYEVWIYWMAVVMVAIFGTMAADVAHVVIGISYRSSTLFFAFALVAIFVTWYACEKTLSIHSITTRRRELFYWATVMATFALGTAAGDMTAATFGLGYFASGVLFAAMFALPFLMARPRGVLNEIVAFWTAYILTRPLGASFADWVGKPYLGGMGGGDTNVSLVLALGIIGCLVYFTIAGQERKSEQR